MKSFTRFFSHVSGATLLSRILGYIRDALVAQAFGAGIAADAFYAAFRIPNLLRRLFGEGALSAAYIPVFNQHLARDGKDAAEHFFQVVFSFLLCVLAVLTLLGMLCAPQLTRLLAWGFQRIPEIEAFPVERFLAELGDNGRAIDTCNHYLSAFKHFCNWLVKNRRMRDNPVVHLEKRNPEQDRRRVRRELSGEEVERLLEAAASSPKVCRGLTGTGG